MINSFNNDGVYYYYNYTKLEVLSSTVMWNRNDILRVPVPVPVPDLVPDPNLFSTVF